MAASTILLQSSDGQVFEAKKGAVLRSVLIAKKLQLRRKSHDNDKDKSPVVLDEIDGETLEKVIKYCDRHYEVDFSPDDEASVNSLDEFDVGVVNVDQTTFFNLIEAAYYLNIKSLIDLTCGALSKKIKGKNYEEIEALAESWR